ncbi:hypothetical protein V5O48_007212 [Marasmius crinis-equi]|uniref:Uncharacterized protein n=1 Tax=Marasmius crinis-equi TaxID=585013 RepID=A0ABR3FHK6_9AGAR
MAKFFPTEPGTFYIPDPVTGYLDEIKVTIEEERIVRFLIDPLVDNSAIGPVWVRCLPCGKRVGLRGNMRFNPNKWLEHRSRCQNARDALRTIRREGRFRSALPREKIRYADEVVDRDEAMMERGVHSRMMPLLERIADFEARSGRDPWANLPSASDSSSPPVTPALVPLISPSSHHHRHHQEHQQRTPEMRTETPSLRDSLTLPPLRRNPSLTAPIRLPSVREAMATQTSLSSNIQHNNTRCAVYFA